MCGRFALTTPHEAVAEHFGALIDPLDEAALPPPPRRDIRPTQMVPVVALAEDGRILTAMRWGFLPHWYASPTAGPLIINARSETVAEKPAFRKAIRERRCLIPANGFFEWKPGPEPGPKRVHWLAPEGEALFGFAGVWREWGEDRLATCAIVTCAANRRLTPIHHRMPVVIDPADYGLWLGEEGKGAARLMQPAVEDFFLDEPGRGPGNPAPSPLL
ncbi:MAG: SOS response-associated peptidase [Pseudomonadota bacterium]